MRRSASKYFALFQLHLIFFALFYLIEKKKIYNHHFSGTYLDIEDGNIDQPVLKQREWENNRFHFDDVAKAMLTLFTVSTFEGWPG